MHCAALDLHTKSDLWNYFQLSIKLEVPSNGVTTFYQWIFGLLLRKWIFNRWILNYALNYLWGYEGSSSSFPCHVCLCVCLSWFCHLNYETIAYDYKKLTEWIGYWTVNVEQRPIILYEFFKSSRNSKSGVNFASNLYKLIYFGWRLA